MPCGPELGKGARAQPRTRMVSSSDVTICSSNLRGRRGTEAINDLGGRRWGGRGRPAPHRARTCCRRPLGPSERAALDSTAARLPASGPGSPVGGRAPLTPPWSTPPPQSRAARCGPAARPIRGRARPRPPRRPHGTRAAPAAPPVGTRRSRSLRHTTSAPLAGAAPARGGRQQPSTGPPRRRLTRPPPAGALHSRPPVFGVHPSRPLGTPPEEAKRPVGERERTEAQHAMLPTARTFRSAAVSASFREASPTTTRAILGALVDVAVRTVPGSGRS
jgi:hypothetical protein